MHVNLQIKKCLLAISAKYIKKGSNLPFNLLNKSWTLKTLIEYYLRITNHVGGKLKVNLRKLCDGVVARRH